MDSAKRTTERRGSLILLTITIFIIIIIVISGICVAVFVEGTPQKITLAVLLFLLIAIGLGSCLFVELQRKRALKKRDRSAELWLQQTLEEQRQANLSAPPMTARKSWALTTPWKQNGHKGHRPGSSLPPYSPPHSTIS